jgi:hypothetical protein
MLTGKEDKRKRTQKKCSPSTPKKRIKFELPDGWKRIVHEK